MNISFESFISFISERFDISTNEISLDTIFTNDLGVDSLSLYSLLDDVEKEFQIELNIEDIIAINTVGKMYKYVSEQFPNR